MHALAAVFFNHRQRRLRALWRILLFLVVWTPVTYLFLVVTGLVLFGRVGVLGEDFAPAAIGGFLAVVVSLWLVGWLVDRRRLNDFGLKLDGNWWLDFVFGLFLGGLAITVAVLVSLAAGWAQVTDTFVSSETIFGRGFALNLAITGLLVLLAAAQEELFCRGYLLTNMAEGFNFPRGGHRLAVLAAVLLSSGIFGAVHMANPNANLMGTTSALLGGLITACGYVLTGRLALPIGLHATWNFFQSSVFGSAVSGMDIGSPSFFLIERSGPELWVGNVYGPESGLLFNLAAAITIPLIVLWVYLCTGRVRLHPDLARPPAAVTAKPPCLPR